MRNENTPTPEIQNRLMSGRPVSGDPFPCFDPLFVFNGESNESPFDTYAYSHKELDRHVLSSQDSIQVLLSREQLERLCLGRRLELTNLLNQVCLDFDSMSIEVKSSEYFTAEYRRLVDMPRAQLFLALKQFYFGDGNADDLLAALVNIAVLRGETLEDGTELDRQIAQVRDSIPSDLDDLESPWKKRRYLRYDHALNAMACLEKIKKEESPARGGAEA
jgi:hypothetical protein